MSFPKTKPSPRQRQPSLSLKGVSLRRLGLFDQDAMADQLLNRELRKLDTDEPRGGQLPKAVGNLSSGRPPELQIQRVAGPRNQNRQLPAIALRR
jgi:hypothetical protein